ncbi:MAG TPA: prepilin-type N-terminal cleavage/methylation domain-containing protein [Kofleriaceae bacterium]|jgi:general secretion pathway protein G|nr:prepilin-type N-terminal cleavage/methylation domain-containing protein [Kofleriaceae bacterium]
MKLVKKVVRNGQRGMTLLEIMIVLAILALVMGLIVGPRVMKMFAESKEDIAKIAAHKFADEAFPQWSRSHPDKGCPDKIDDLTEYMNSNNKNDPWGTEWKLLCPPNLPAGVRTGIAIVSAGPDKKEGTSDDIKSWE